MKFLVDAQLPRSLSKWLIELGHDSIHTLDLPQQNESQDRDISFLADQQNRVVISKDNDFFDDHLLLNSPIKLLALRVGNIRNSELLQIFSANLDQIALLLETNNLVEVTKEQIIVHP